MRVTGTHKTYNPSHNYTTGLLKSNVILCPRCGGGVEAHYKGVNIHCARCGDKCGKLIRRGK